MLHRHQRALHTYSLMKRQVVSAAAQSREPESVEQLESRIVEVRLGWCGGRAGGAAASCRPPRRPVGAPRAAGTRTPVHQCRRCGPEAGLGLGLGGAPRRAGPGVRGSLLCSRRA